MLWAAGVFRKYDDESNSIEDVHAYGCSDCGIDEVLITLLTTKDLNLRRTFYLFKGRNAWRDVPDCKPHRIVSEAIVSSHLMGVFNTYNSS